MKTNPNLMSPFSGSGNFSNFALSLRIPTTIFMLLLLLILGNTRIVQAQPTIQSKLKEDIVSVSNGNYTAEEFWLLRWEHDITLQIKVTASSPVDVISRDNFVSIFSTNATVLLLYLLADEELPAPQFVRIDELIGEADMVIHFVMTRNGMQTQVITHEGRENVTLRWEEIFEM